MSANNICHNCDQGCGELCDECEICDRSFCDGARSESCSDKWLIVIRKDEMWICMECIDEQVQLKKKN
jgi:hypothetical protein